MDQNSLRNFCIIAHIDHGKSTLSDRLLEYTHTVAKREMKAQILDSMELERERGITIKLAPVRMNVPAREYIDNPPYEEFILNLIDTPGHVDFNYEVSRSLAAVEGALLLIDATQGVQAQTIGNLYLALEQNLTIIPVVNKIDMAIAKPEETAKEIMGLLGCAREDILFASGKTGEGVNEIVKHIIKKIPPPRGDTSPSATRALIFDSVYDDFRGVVAYVRVVDGQIKRGDSIYMFATETYSEVIEVGHFKPKLVTADTLSAGEIGYVVTGLKNIVGCRVGDTITIKKQIKESGARGAERANAPAIQPLPGYKEVVPMVFAGIFCKEGTEYERMRDAVLKLKLNDSALMFEPEHSQALGFGFRCGFLGLLHLDIFQERLHREYKLNLVVTVPSVAYRVELTNGETITIKSPQELPDPSRYCTVFEPWVKADIVLPKNYLGNIIGLLEERHGKYVNTEYLEGGRVILHYLLPLSVMLVDFYDRLKSLSSGYASLNYEMVGYEPAEVVRLDIIVAEELVEALSTLTYESECYFVGRRIVEKLKESLPKQMFEVKIQAAIGSKVIASERIPAMRKDVLAKMSGGDWTRKAKLLKKQKEGKSRMRVSGRVDIPTETYLSVLKRDS
ncbi:MAG: elongation factor 4 [Candidatus Magasanikbacteria bacterium]|nr:elongation factor 4 [Candidatus Magasanikbacteria bacterium]